MNAVRRLRAAQSEAPSDPFECRCFQGVRDGVVVLFAEQEHVTGGDGGEHHLEIDEAPSRRVVDAMRGVGDGRRGHGDMPGRKACRTRGRGQRLLRLDGGKGADHGYSESRASIKRKNRQVILYLSLCPG